MSGVTRMHGRFGKNLVAQMLCGSKSKRLSQWRLNQLSTYGLLSAMKQAEVAMIMDRLSEFGLVVQQEIEQRRPTIHMTEIGREIMHGRSPMPDGFHLPKELASKLIHATKSVESIEEPSPSATNIENEDRACDQIVTGETQSTGEPNQPFIEETTATLKRWRRKTSAALGLPAFKVLTNATLERIAISQPENMDALKMIKGIGESNSQQFGQDIIELIRCTREQVIDTRPEDLQEKKVVQNTNTNGNDAINFPEQIRIAAKEDHPTHEDSCCDRVWVGSDAYWSHRLLEQGFTHEEILLIRRITKKELEKHLQLAVAHRDQGDHEISGKD